MTVSTLAAPLRRVAADGLAERVRAGLTAARARRDFRSAAAGDHRLQLELAAASRRAH